jgi:hypothetical protein
VAEKYKNKNWNNNWANQNYNVTGIGTTKTGITTGITIGIRTRRKTGTRITRTSTGIGIMCGLGSRDPITASSSAASSSGRS